MRNSHYTLFISEAHSPIRFDFPKKVIETFREMWEEGKDMETMCTELKIEYTEFMLIALDLNYIDALQTRKNGLLGH